MEQAMQLNIKNDEAHRMAAELAKLTGESMSEAVTRAIRQRLELERRRKVEARGDDFEARIAAIVDQMDKYPVLDDRPGDEILYDEDGLPK